MRNAPPYGRPLNQGQPASEPDQLMDRPLLSSGNGKYPRRKIESRASEEPVGVDEIKSGVTPTGTWQPKWLRSSVLGLFGALFVVFTLGLPMLLQYSQRRDGIIAARQNFVYVWRFGPTAVLTVVAAFWARVELQAMRYMPWTALHDRGLSLDKYIATLDYTSMLLPTALVQSLRRQHYLLSLVIVTSILLVGQVALAPGVFSLAAVRVEQDTGIQTLDSFDTETDYANETTLRTETSAFYTVRAIHDFDMAHPFGVSDLVAYQTFESRGGRADDSRGTVREPLRAVVDGLFAEVQCLKLKSHSVLAANEYLHPGPFYTFDVDLHFDECDKPISVSNTWITPTSKTKEGQWLVENRLRPEKACSGLPQKNKQFVYYAALFGPSARNHSRPAIHKAAALVCTPAAWLSKVEVVDDGVSPNITLLPNQERRPIAANPWELLRKSNPSIFHVDGSMGTGGVAGPVGADWLRNVDADPADPSLYENDLLLNSTTNVLQTMIPFLGHYVLRRKGAAEATGTRIPTVDKLMVNRRVCLSMTALFGTTTVVVFIVLVGYGRSRRTSTWRRDPATIFGSMIFFQGHAELLDQLAGLTSKSSSADWSQCNYSPLVLRGYFRAFATTLITGAVVGLIITHRMSVSSDGIASIDEEGYTHLLWTSVPALTMLCISLYVSSCNTAYRSLCAFPPLSAGPSSSSREMDSSLLDMTGVRALYRSIRLGCHTVTLSQLLALACGFLTTFASVLFTGKHTIPRQDSVLFPQETWFGNQPAAIESRTRSKTRQSLSGLLMRQGESSLNYPRNTFHDLAFPALGGIQDLELSRTLSVNITTPAAQLHSTCRKLSQGDDYRVVFGGPRESNLYAELLQPYTCPNGTRIELTDGLTLADDTNLRGQVYVGQTLRSVDDVAEVNTPCRLGLNTSESRFATQKHETYLWGRYSNGTEFEKSMFIYACTYEWTEVITKVHLVPVDGALIIDPANPPQPDPSTRRPWSRPFDVPRGNAFPQIILDEKWAFLQAPYEVLVQPYGKLAFEDLADPSKEEEILGALRRNVGFISAQLANIENRLVVNASSRTGPPPAEGFPAIQATVVSRGDYRLVQDARATYVLIGILGAVVLFNIWGLISAALRRSAPSENGLLAMDVRGLAPEGFNSFAALGSLLRDSNVSSHLMPGADLLSTEELHGMHSHLGFRLGWFRDESDQSRHFTIGVLGDESFKFLGRKKTV